MVCGAGRNAQDIHAAQQLQRGQFVQKHNGSMLLTVMKDCVG
jgi:hypothetical protein